MGEPAKKLDSSLSVAQAYTSHRKKPRRPHRHDEGEGNWLISYADMMTLLVGFFIVLLSFSKIDSGEFEKLKKATLLVFGGEYKIPFENLALSLEDIVKKQNLENQVFIKTSDEGVEITFRGALFFDSASVVLRKEASELLGLLIPEISSQANDYGIIVEGHTDNRPVSSGFLVSNWELSSLRACTVLRLFESRGFNPKRLKAIGWGEQKPILPNEDKNKNPLLDNQSQNRRVVVKIVKQIDD